MEGEAGKNMASGDGRWAATPSATHKQVCDLSDCMASGSGGGDSGGDGGVGIEMSGRFELAQFEESAPSTSKQTHALTGPALARNEDMATLGTTMGATFGAMTLAAGAEEPDPSSPIMSTIFGISQLWREAPVNMCDG